jgi:hypothetical protein
MKKNEKVERHNYQDRESDMHVAQPLSLLFQFFRLKLNAKAFEFDLESFLGDRFIVILLIHLLGFPMLLQDSHQGHPLSAGNGADERYLQRNDFPDECCFALENKFTQAFNRAV